MNMLRINPYLNFNGTTEKAFNFYKSVFGGEFSVLQRFKDTQEAEKISAEDREKIMHVSLPVGRNMVLMATDAPESMGFKLIEGNNFYLSLDAESREEADELFAKLSAGGKVEMKLEDTFWGAYFGHLIDAFGIRWMISYAKT
jgi:PhnB protein